MRRGFTLVEMLTTVAVLIIVLGLMVSLARNVRHTSAQQLTKQMLQQLGQLMNGYVERNDNLLPRAAPIIPAEIMRYPDESSIQLLARKNNEDFVRALREDLARLDRRPVASVLGQLPISVYDGVTLRDAWGSPIVFMPHQHFAIGMAPKGKQGESYFFFSAGPDRRYLTRDDNLYSYETLDTRGERLQSGD